MALELVLALHQTGPVAGGAAFEGAALILRETAPDASVLPTFQSPGEAGLFDRAALTDLFSFLYLSQSRPGIADRKEEFRILIAAGRLVSPIHLNLLQLREDLSGGLFDGRLPGSANSD